MEDNEANFAQNPKIKTQKVFILSQICVRVCVIALTLASAWIMLRSKETAMVFGVPFVARYSYAATYKFFAYANVSVCALALVSLFYALLSVLKGANPNSYFLLFLGDLCMMVVVLCANSAAAAEGYLGKHGNTYAGWLPICPFAHTFCDRVLASIALSSSSFFLLLLLTLLSAVKSRQI